MPQQREIPWAILLVVVAILAALGGWYFWQQNATRQAVKAPAASPAAVPAEPAGPQYPLPAASSTDDATRNLQPLPALDDSDQYFKLELSGLFGTELADFFVTSALIERLVATIDNLPRQQVAERIRPVDALPGQLEVAGQDGSGEFMLIRDNYQRYDAIVSQVAAADPEQLAELYRRYYPLFQNAYVGLGYPDGYFNDRLIEVIDHLLATPDTAEPVLLIRPHVLYRYADPELEALSSGQKLLIRIGPGHRATVKESLGKLRSLLVSAGLER